MLLRLPFLLLLVMLHCAASAQQCVGTNAAGVAKLDVEATDVRNARGEVAFTVYNDDPKRFMARRGKVLRARVSAIAPVTTACFWLPPGQYATTQYHDENADHDFNRALFMPKEGFGFSNDASVRLGLPSLKDALFSLPPEGRMVRMKMRYRR